MSFILQTERNKRKTAPRRSGERQKTHHEGFLDLRIQLLALLGRSEKSRLSFNVFVSPLAGQQRIRAAGHPVPPAPAAPARRPSVPRGNRTHRQDLLRSALPEGTTSLRRRDQHRGKRGGTFTFQPLIVFKFASLVSR